jgi:preprotein translocase subunit SecB
LAKQKRDEEMFKILEMYQKDLKIEVPATPPAPPNPNSAQAPPK